MTVKWNGDAIVAAVRAATVTGLTSGTEAVRTEATSLMNSSPRTGRTYGRHVASGPGEPPAPDTGNLIANITTAVDADKLTGSVNFGTAYAKRLEYGFVGTDSLGRVYDQAARPFARPALENKKGEVQSDIATAIAGALK